MILLWLILILLPIWVGIVIWTNVAQKLWFKIVASVAMVISCGLIILWWSTYNELEDANSSIYYVVERDIEYIECIDNADDFDTMFDGCIVPFLKDLRDTYK